MMNVMNVDTGIAYIDIPEHKDAATSNIFCGGYIERCRHEKC